MQMPSQTGDITHNFGPSTMETARHKGSNKDPALHNKLANFVLELQSDVTLEDLLDNGENTKSVMQSTQEQKCVNEHRQALRQLYEEIKNNQHGLINTQEQTTKRRSSEGSIGFGKTKVLRNSESSLLQDIDSIDENWLMKLASQLGLDKDRDLPELNFDWMQELI